MRAAAYSNVERARDNAARVNREGQCYALSVARLERISGGPHGHCKVPCWNGRNDCQVETRRTRQVQTIGRDSDIVGLERTRHPRLNQNSRRPCHGWNHVDVRRVKTDNWSVRNLWADAGCQMNPA